MEIKAKHSLISAITNGIYCAYSKQNTSSGWYGNHEQDIFDDEAFSFLIRSNRKYEPRIFNVIEPEKAIKLQPGWYCNIEIYVNGAGNDLEFNGGARKQSVVYERNSIKSEGSMEARSKAEERDRLCRC